MKKGEGLKRFAISSAILVMIAMYSSFLTLDVHSGYSDSSYSRVLRYLGILICLGLVFAAGKDANNQHDLKLMKWAVSFTAVADFVMSMACNFDIFQFGFCTNFGSYRFMLGTVLFVVVQLILIQRHRKQFRWRPLEFLTAILVFGFMIDKFLRDLTIITQGGASYKPVLIVVMTLYAGMLCVSLWMAIGTLWRGYFPKQTAWLITIGMLLFFFCDNSLARAVLFPDHAPSDRASSFIVATNHLRTSQTRIIDNQVYVYADEENAKDLQIPYSRKSIAGILVWFFYLPAQVLLMLSTYNPNYLNSVFGAYPKIRGQSPPVLQNKARR